MNQPFENLLPGVPDVESPFFEQIFATKNVSSQALDIARQLHEKGFAVFTFPDPDIDRIADAIVSSLKASYDTAGVRAAGVENPRVQDAWRFDGNVRRLAVNQKILDLLGQLYGRPAFPFQTLNFPVGTEQHYHTDSIHFSSIPERFMCAVWIALEDIDEANGPLIYYPGSHKWPIYTNEHIGVNPGPTAYSKYDHYLKTWEALVAAHEIEPEYFHARKGQALIWAANLLHGGAPQRDKARTRYSQVTHYYFEGCSYYTPLLSVPYLGTINFREISDISTGRTIPNQINGTQVPADFIRESAPGNRRSQGSAESVLPADFDPAAYLKANPDVAAAGVDAAGHWLKYGNREGRPLR